MRSSIKLLIIGNDADELHSLFKVVESLSVQPIIATSMERVRNVLDADSSVGLVILDHLAVTNEIRAFCQKLEEQKGVKSIHYIKQHDQATVQACFDAGAADFIQFPFNIDIVQHRVRHFLELYKSNVRTSKLVSRLHQESSYRHEQKFQIKDLEARLAYLKRNSKNSSSTGNSQRVVSIPDLYRRVNLAIESAVMQQEQHCLLYIDLDNFMIWQKNYGNAIAMDFVQHVLALLSTSIRSRDAVAQIGHDEFVVLLERCKAVDAQQMAEQIRSIIKNSVSQEFGELESVTASIGLEFIDRSSISGEQELVKKAKKSCLRAKKKGKDCVFSCGEVKTLISREKNLITWQHYVADALEQDSFVLVKQKVVAVGGDSECDRYEIFLRLLQNGVLISPRAFFESRSRPDLWVQVDFWVVRHVLAWLAKMDEQGKEPLCVNLNLSEFSLYDAKALDHIKGMVEHYGISPKRICFDISEKDLRASNKINLVSILQSWADAGFTFALDDYCGCGSMLSLVSNMPFEYVKVSHEIVNRMMDDPVYYGIAKSINASVRAIGVKTVAEHVENAGVSGQLQEIGYHYLQGYFFGEPTKLFEEAS